jgi:RNA polymerase sigma-70 factor (ECF subfamily)
MPRIEATGDALMMIGSAHPKKDATLKLVSTEAGLLDAVRQGSQDGFAQLYKQYSPMVHGILLARVPYSEVADLVQDVFLTAYRQLSSLRDDNAFGGWLATIARNRANDFHRRSVDSEELTEAHHGQRDSDAQALEILMVIRTLPEAYRETLVLRLVEGMTGPEIAERTGLTPDSVRVNLHRGTKMLREKLGLEKSV